MHTWAIILVFCIGIAWSIRLRVSRFRQVLDNTEIKSTPLSLAIQELIAVAGGLYLSLVMLVSFLKIEIPEKLLILNISIDPLAGSAILLAVVQPIFVKLFKNMNY